MPSAPVAPHGDGHPSLYQRRDESIQGRVSGYRRRDYRRAVDTQKCIRVSGHHNDLEEVGFSSQHHTFFEMLGNWSFGDYFKRGGHCVGLGVADRGLATSQKNDSAPRYLAAIRPTGVAADEEAEALWTEVTDLPAERVYRLGRADNFWQMGETGPCGPCSEVHYYPGDNPASWFREDPDFDGRIRLKSGIWYSFSSIGMARASFIRCPINTWTPEWGSNASVPCSRGWNPLTIPICSGPFSRRSAKSPGNPATMNIAWPCGSSPIISAHSVLQ